MITEDRAFNVAGETLMATKVYAASAAPPDIISFHGTGITANRRRIRYILDHLATQGMSSVCFDFSGHGQSTGRLDQSTLNIRKSEAEAATRLLLGNNPPVFIGTSMGAYLAALLTPVFEPRSLILFCPAAYPAKVMGMTFNDNFTAFVRRPSIYRHSPAFRALSNFKGSLLIIAAERDALIPREVIDLYAESARCARSQKIIWIERSDHKVHSWLVKHDEQRTIILESIVSAVMGGNPTIPINGSSTHTSIPL
jgi:uncharacterized protein